MDLSGLIMIIILLLWILFMAICGLLVCGRVYALSKTMLPFFFFLLPFYYLYQAESDIWAFLNKGVGIHLLRNSNREFEFDLCYFSSLVDMMPVNLYPSSDPQKWVFRIK